MTGLIVTDTKFKRFAKNFKKLKPELSVVGAQEELAKIFGFKNLFHIKEHLKQSKILINNENFSYFSNRLNIRKESSKSDDFFANIIGYENARNFNLRSFLDEFINCLNNMINKKESTIVKCVLCHITKDEDNIILIIGDEVNRDTILITFNRNSSYKYHIFDVRNSDRFKTIHQPFKNELELLLDLFKNKDLDFLSELYQLMLKVFFIHEEFKILTLPKEKTIKIGDFYYEKLCILTSVKNLNKHHFEKFNDEYIYSKSSLILPDAQTYKSYEDAYANIHHYAKMKNLEFKELCIFETYSSVFNSNKHSICKEYFLMNDDVKIARNFII